MEGGGYLKHAGSTLTVNSQQTTVKLLYYYHHKKKSAQWPVRMKATIFLHQNPSPSVYCRIEPP